MTGTLVLAALFAAADPESIPDLVRAAEKAADAKDYPAAAAAWDKVVARNPDNGTYWLALAQASYSAKDYRPSIAAYEKALELRAGFPAVAAYNIACSYALMGEKKAALKGFEKAMALGYRNPTAAGNDPDLKSLRDEPKFRDLVGLVDANKLSRDERWRYDLAYLAREIKRLHYNPYRLVTREQFDAEVRQIHDAIPKLTDPQIEARFRKLVRLAGDGHTTIRPPDPRLTLPVQLYQFAEGVFVTAAAPGHEDLAGAQVLKVGDRTTAEVLTALEPVISRDNPMGLKLVGPGLMTVPRLLHGLDLIPDADKATLTIRDLKDTERTITLTATADQPSEKWATGRDPAIPAPLYLKNRTAPYWFEYLKDSKSVYFQYNAVRSDLKEPLDKFCDRLFQFINENDVDRLVIDVRWNGGGNSFLNRPIVHGVVRCPKVNQRGRLFAIIGRNTFSAAQNFSTDLDMHTAVTFVGEPTGSSPNFIGETIRFTLPCSKMYGSISDLYWGRGWPMDYRIWIPPTLPAPPMFAAYRAGRDPALEAILAQPVPPAK